MVSFLHQVHQVVLEKWKVLLSHSIFIYIFFVDLINHTKNSQFISKPKPSIRVQSKFAWHTFSHNNKQGKDVKAFQVTLEMNHHSSSRSFSNSNEKVFPWVADVWFLLLLLLITLALPAEEDFLKTPSRIVVFPTSALSLFARDFNFFCR